MKIRRLLGTCLLLASASVAQALGLGEILVKSRLNQPLEAEIVVREAFPGEAEGLTVRLATAEDFARVGLERAWIPSVLAFDTVADDRGRTIIRVTSQDPIREPNLSLLIDVNWAGGRLLREYGLLLDPVVSPQSRQLQRPPAPPSTPRPPPVPQAPVAATPAPVPAAPGESPAPAAVPAPPVSPPPTGFADPAVSRSTQAATPPPAPAPIPAEPAASDRDDGTYTVSKGDTLSAIAYELASDMGVNTNQMMLALQRNNASAFFAENINALKAGAVLRVPDMTEVRSIAVSDARVEVRRQLDSWNSQRTASALADPGVATASTAVPAGTQAPTQARVELLSPRSDDESGSTSAGGTGRQSGGAQVAEIEADLKRTREELTSRDQEVAELASRVRDLEEMNAQNARLLELKNAEVAALQRRLADLSGQADAAALASEAISEATSEVMSTPAEMLADAGDAAAEVAGDSEESPDSADTVASVDQASPEAADSEVGSEGPTEQASDEGMVASDQREAAGDATTEAAEAAATPTEMADSISEAGMEPAGSTELSDQEWEAAATSGNPDPFATEEAASNLAPASASATAAPVVTTAPPSAPATEQPFYMNPMYLGAALVLLALVLALALLSRRGRRSSDAQDTEASSRRSVSDMFAAAPVAAGAGRAETTGGDAEVAELLAHIQANPDSHDSYVELLSVFYANGDSERFSHWAQRLRQKVSADSLEWQAVADMGRELLPTEPLFAQDAATGPDDAVAAWSGVVTPADEEAAAASAAPASWRQDDDILDLGEQEVRPVGEQVDELLEETVQIDEAEEAETSFEPLEFNPDESDLRPLAVDDSLPVAEPAGADHSQLPPLDFETSFESAPAAETGSQSRAGGRGGDDVATKLELARAYLDMGDPDGARAMLEEVLGEGDTAQREQAARLLDSI